MLFPPYFKQEFLRIIFSLGRFDNAMACMCRNMMIISYRDYISNEIILVGMNSLPKSYA